jgi:LAO/AO transport system kinase
MSPFLNPQTDPARFKPAITDLPKLERGILNGDVSAIGRAITLVESKKKEDQGLASQLISRILPHTGKGLRLGISGVPGVGKSTFIEAFGQFLIEKHGLKVAVLAVDPSSGRTGGSILGDKTRMEALSRNPKAFIRPSPSAGTLGGVAGKTRQAMLLCDAAGYDVIIIETVGVGQSEVAVKSMVDCFLLLLLPGAGDELQGIKRGIMEMADLIAINKSDGDQVAKAKRAAADVRRALHLYPELESGWTVPVTPCSAIESLGIDTLWQQIQSFKHHMVTKGLFETNRNAQLTRWFDESLQEAVMNHFFENQAVIANIGQIQGEILKQKMDPQSAVQELIKLWRKPTQ